MFFLHPIPSPQNHLSPFDLKIDGIDLFFCICLFLFGFIFVEGEIWPQEVFGDLQGNRLIFPFPRSGEEESLPGPGVLSLASLKSKKVKGGKALSLLPGLDIPDDDPFFCIWVKKFFIIDDPFFQDGSNQFQSGLSDGRIEAFLFQNLPFPLM